jgi:hypothetical protein
MAEPLPYQPAWNFEARQEVDCRLAGRKMPDEPPVLRALREEVAAARQEVPASNRLALALLGLASRLGEDGQYDEAIRLTDEAKSVLRNLGSNWAAMVEDLDDEIADLRRRKEWSEKDQIVVEFPPPR